MDGIKEAWDIVFGEGVFEDTISTIIKILIICGSIIIFFVIMAIWQFVAKSKIKKAMMMISEYPDNEHSVLFLNSIKRITIVGKTLAKIGFGFVGLSKSDCREIFNTTIFNSNFIDLIKKKELRKAMISVGCTGLLAL